jgi:hypothetical protein
MADLESVAGAKVCCPPEDTTGKETAFIPGSLPQLPHRRAVHPRRARRRAARILRSVRSNRSDVRRSQYPLARPEPPPNWRRLSPSQRRAQRSCAEDVERRALARWATKGPRLRRLGPLLPRENGSLPACLKARPVISRSGNPTVIAYWTDMSSMKPLYPPPGLLGWL